MIQRSAVDYHFASQRPNKFFSFSISRAIYKSITDRLKGRNGGERVNQLKPSIHNVRPQKNRAGKGFHNLEGSIEGKRWKIYRVFNPPLLPNFPPKVVSQMRLRGCPVSTGSNLASGRLSDVEWSSITDPFPFLCPATPISRLCIRTKVLSIDQRRVETSGPGQVGPSMLLRVLRKRSTWKVRRKFTFYPLINLLLSAKIDDEFSDSKDRRKKKS